MATETGNNVFSQLEHDLLEIMFADLTGTIPELPEPGVMFSDQTRNTLVVEAVSAAGLADINADAAYIVQFLSAEQRITFGNNMLSHTELHCLRKTCAALIASHTPGDSQTLSDKLHHLYGEVCRLHPAEPLSAQQRDKLDYLLLSVRKAASRRKKMRHLVGVAQQIYNTAS